MATPLFLLIAMVGLSVSASPALAAEEAENHVRKRNLEFLLSYEQAKWDRASLG